jgi:transcriptional regulator with XRE-family HTH domain
MPRPSIPPEQKTREGRYLEAKIIAAQDNDDYITQDLIAYELGITQGNVSHWIKGRTAIPDKHFIWLGKRLGFDPTEIRPSLANYNAKSIMTNHEKLILEAYRIDPNFRKSVDTIAEMSSFYRSAQLHDSKSHQKPHEEATAKKKSNQTHP